MKTNRVKWEAMWEKYFENYAGWTSLYCNKNTSSKFSNEQKDVIKGDLPAKSYPTELEPFDVKLQHNSQTDFNEYKVKSFLKPPEHHNGDKFYPVDEYMDSSYDEINFVETNTVDKTINEEKSGSIVKGKTVFKQPKKIIFECNTGQGFAFIPSKHIPLICTSNINFISKTLGTVSIDTSSLKRAKTKVVFTSNLFFIPKKDKKGTAQLEFVLYRACNGGYESHVGNWAYEIIDKDEELSQSFKLSFCSCNSYPGNYDFIVRVFPVYIENCSLCITNCHLSAIAQ